LPVPTAPPLAQSGAFGCLRSGANSARQVSEVPTLAEPGVAGFDVDLWYAVAPAARFSDHPECVSRLRR
jgi:tripartite-type tricarboxylate transporter receptor subunit TctC